MRYTRSQMWQICRNDARVVEAGADDESLSAAINCLMSDMVKHGLTYIEQHDSFHTSGRPVHAYDASSLFKYLSGYLVGVKNHRINLRKGSALSIIDHLKVLGYDQDSVCPDHKETRDQKIKRLTRFIFGSKKKEVRCKKCNELLLPDAAKDTDIWDTCVRCEFGDRSKKE